jgi:hypothetical protein
LLVKERQKQILQIWRGFAQESWWKKLAEKSFSFFLKLPGALETAV